MNSPRHAGLHAALIAAFVITWSGAMLPSEAADLEPLPTYSTLTHRFPTTAVLRPPDVVRFRSTQLMFTLIVDRTQLDAMLSHAGWASTGISDQARIQVFWDFSCREQYRGLGYLPGVDNQKTFGPGNAFYIGTNGVSLSDPDDSRYLILMWVVDDIDSVERMNTVHGGNGADVAYLGDIETLLASKSSAVQTYGIRSIYASVVEPESGFSFALAAVLPTSVTMHRVVDDPLGLPVTWLDVSSGTTGHTSVWSEQSGYQRFMSRFTPGFYMKLPVGGTLRFPGGWEIAIRKWDDTLNVYTDVEGHGKLVD